MRPHQFKTRRVQVEGHLPVLVKGMYDQHQAFDYVMTEEGVKNFLTPSHSDKTPFSQLLDEKIFAKKRPTLFMLKAPAGCGKTTWARDYMKLNPNTVRFNRDDLRAMAVSQFDFERDAMLRAWQYDGIVRALLAGYDVIADNTHLKPSDEPVMQNLATRGFADLEVVDLTLPIDKAIANDTLRVGRPGFIGRHVIERQYLDANLLKWSEKPVVIVDLDGTLADLEHRAHLTRDRRTCDLCSGTGISPASVEIKCGPCKGRGLMKKDYPLFFRECLKDRPVDIVIRWVNALAEDHTVVLVSGRDMEFAGMATVVWLQLAGVKYDRLFMRLGKDYRHDTIIKKEILDRMLAGGLKKEQIAFCIDDRLSVIKMWREEGLKVYPVRCSERDFE